MNSESNHESRATNHEPRTTSHEPRTTTRVYVFCGTGILACFNTKTGKKIWDVDTLKEFEAENITWGITGSPLIDGQKVYCTPGGKKGTVVALDKMTGQTIWATTGLSEASAYSQLVNRE